MLQNIPKESMKRSGFTLVELILVIVIIGVLAALAVPRYQNLKQNSEVNVAIKTMKDEAQSIPVAFVNRVDLEDDNASAITISDLVSLSGKGWNTANDNNYTFIAGGTARSWIALNPSNRTVSYKIDGNSFGDAKSKEKCVTNLGSDTNTTITIVF